MVHHRGVVRFIVLAAIMVAGVNSANFLTVSGWEVVALDFEVFWRAAGEPLSDIYRPKDMPFAYPPTALLLFFPLRFVELETGFIIWTFLSIGMFAYGVAKICGPLTASISLLSTAAILGLVLGQVTMLLAGLAFLALSLPPFACGVVLAFVAVVKPQLMLFAPLVFLMRRDWIILAGIVVGGLVFLLLSVGLFGFHIWRDWFSAASSLVSSSVPSLITPSGQAAYRGIPEMPVWVASVALSAAAVFAWSNKIDDAKLIALIVATSVVASPYGHAHDTIAIIPACVAMLGNPVMTLLAFLVITGPQLLTMLAMVLGLVLCICAKIILSRAPL